MANQEQLEILKQGAPTWNKWRAENRGTFIDLIEANLTDVNLSEVNLDKTHCERANFSGANLREAFLMGAILTQTEFHDADLTKVDLRLANLESSNLTRACLRNANLKDANLSHAYLQGANFREADLRQCHLRGCNFSNADLREANLVASNLGETILINTKIDGAKISRSSIYGISVWDLNGEFEEQKDLIITREGEPVITVDNVEIAQFIHLILHNNKIRDVINTLTSKSVLIVGRFSIPERKEILEILRNKLREYNLLPIVFDFDRPTDKDFTETIKTLASLSYFVIADVTNPKSSPLELQATIPDYQIPFVPIIQEGEKPFSMMTDLQKKYPWVLNTVSYDSEETLIKALKPLIIDPAMRKRQELRIIKAQEPEIISAKDFLAKGET